MNRGDLSIRQWDCGCMGVGLILLFGFFQYGFTGDTFNYMMCVKDPSNITISDSCSSKMCDWQRQLGKGAEESNVNCLVVRHSMFRTVSTTLLELKDPLQVTWTKERMNRTNIVINGTAYDATKALFTVYALPLSYSRFLSLLLSFSFSLSLSLPLSLSSLSLSALS
jgi:hypothetical protein